MTRLQVLGMLLLPGFLSAQSVGGITGTLSDDTGAPVGNGMVSVTFRGPANSGKFSPILNVKTGSDGKFALTGLAAGTYTLCAPNASAGLLDPCLWKTSPTTVSVAASAQPATIALVAARGVQVSVQVNDPQGLLAASGAVDDIMIGTRGASAASPFLAASLLSKNSSGKTVSLLVPPNQSVGVLASSQLFQLADSQGNLFPATSVLTNVTTPAIGAMTGATANPVLTLTIHSPSGK